MVDRKRSVGIKIVSRSSRKPKNSHMHILVRDHHMTKKKCRQKKRSLVENKRLVSLIKMNGIELMVRQCCTEIEKARYTSHKGKKKFQARVASIFGVWPLPTRS